MHDAIEPDDNDPDGIEGVDYIIRPDGVKVWLANFSPAELRRDYVMRKDGVIVWPGGALSAPRPYACTRCGTAPMYSMGTFRDRWMVLCLPCNVLLGKQRARGTHPQFFCKCLEKLNILAGMVGPGAG